MSAWVVPTARAIDWLPLATAAGLLTGLSGLAAYTGHWPAAMLGVAAGALAAATVAGLRDPAAALTAALPTSATRRLARRLALLVPVAAASWLAVLWPGQTAVPDIGWPVAPLLALLATGVAVAELVPSPGALVLGAAVPLAWTAAARIGTHLDQQLAEVLLAWQHHPLIVITAAVAALVWKRTR